jgi:hypothetical protein
MHVDVCETDDRDTVSIVELWWLGGAVPQWHVHIDKSTVARHTRFDGFFSLFPIYPLFSSYDDRLQKMSTENVLRSALPCAKLKISRGTVVV